MAYNPGNQNMSGQIIGQGILEAAQGLSQGWMAAQQKKEQDKVFTAQSKATERLLNVYLPKEQAAEVLAVNPKETPEARHARLTGTIENFVVENKLKQFQQAQQQAAKDENAFNSAVKHLITPDGKPSNFDSRIFIGEYLRAGGSAQSLDKVDQAIKMMVPQPGKPVLDLKSYRSADPTTGKPIEVTIDELTGKEIGRGPMADPPSTTINMGNKMKQTAYESFQKSYADTIEPIAATAPSIEAMRDLLEVTDNKGVITGALANIELAAKSWANDLGIGNFKDVASTQAYIGSAAVALGQIIKQFGAGTGLSDEDRKIANRAVGGEIKMDKPALQRLVTAAERVMKKRIGDYNARVSKTFKGDDEEAVFARDSLIVPEIQFGAKPTNSSKTDSKQDATAEPKLPDGWKIVK